MRLKYFFLLILALPLMGCDDFSPNPTYYTYGNATDKIITVTTYIVRDTPTNIGSPTRIFTIAPGEEFSIFLSHSYGQEVSYKAVMPFADIPSNYLTISDGEQVVGQQYYTPGSLLQLRYYERIDTKKTVYLKYILTEKVFEHNDIIIPEQAK